MALPPRCLISIVGPTATGKTKRALQLADSISTHQQPQAPRWQGCDLISADSRQVYAGLETVTGADIPDGFCARESSSFHSPFFERNATRIHGISILSPDEDWSLAHFQSFVWQIIKQSWQDGSLPILVGGTGLYHHHLTNTDLRHNVGPDFELRSELETLTFDELTKRAQQSDEDAFNRMNHSDRNNPRRLMRLVERVENTQQSLHEVLAAEIPEANSYTHCEFGLLDSIENIEQAIAQRVTQRLRAGAVYEVAALLEDFSHRKKTPRTHQKKQSILTATGVQEIISFLDGDIHQAELEEKWVQKERQYAKRQLTWWKKRDGITWFAADAENIAGEMWEILIKKLPVDQ